MNNEKQSISQRPGKGIILLSQHLDEKSHHALHFHKMPKTFIEVFIGQLANGSQRDASNRPGERDVWSNNKLDIEIRRLNSTADKLQEPGSAH